MSFFTSARASRARSKLKEEKFWAAAADEVASGVIRTGLWAQALAESSGDEGAAKSRYLQLRFEALKDEAALVEEARLNRERALKKVARVSNRSAHSDEWFAALSFLKARNYRVTEKADGYAIREPLGGKCKRDSECEVIAYAVERGFVRR